MTTLKAYHGTYNQFDEFSNERINWFTKDIALANQYGEIILECEIGYNNAFYVGEANEYMDQCDGSDFDENDNVITYNGYFVPEKIRDIANELNIKIDTLINIYQKDGHDIYDDGAIKWMTEQTFAITSSIYFADLLKEKGYDCIIQEENGVPTYGILNNKNIKILN